MYLSTFYRRTSSLRWPISVEALARDRFARSFVIIRTADSAISLPIETIRAPIAASIRTVFSRSACQSRPVDVPRCFLVDVIRVSRWSFLFCVLAPLPSSSPILPRPRFTDRLASKPRSGTLELVSSRGSLCRAPSRRRRVFRPRAGIRHSFDVRASSAGAVTGSRPFRPSPFASGAF
jgi:hypothetical protein